MEQLLKRIKQVHEDCVKLCLMAVGRVLPIAGNIGVFAQSEEEYEAMAKVAQELVGPWDEPNRKYYKLKEPIVFPPQSGAGRMTYEWLYIRKYDPGPYGRYLGDVDFVMESEEYAKYKQLVQEGKIKGAEMHDRPGWETWHIADPTIKSIAYVEMVDMAEKVRVKFD